MQENESDTTTTTNIVNPFFHVFEGDIFDESVTAYEYDNYKESNVSNTTALNRYIIETRDKDSLILPSDGYLDVEYQLMQPDGVTRMLDSDKCALQNNAMSLFKDATYYIEDQQIEYILDPGLSYTIKNISDYSKQYGESIASNQGFYLDTQDGASTKGCNLRFFNDVAAPNARRGVELYISANATPNLFVSFPLTSATTWIATDPVVAMIGDYLTGYQVRFTSIATNTRVANNLDLAGVAVRTIALDAGGQLMLNNAGADLNEIQAYVLVNGLQQMEVKFYRNVLLGNTQAQIFLLQHGVAAAGGTPINATGGTPIINGDKIFGSANIENSYNKGFQKRLDRARKTIPVNGRDYFMIPLKDIFQFCRQYKKVSRGLKHTIILNRNSDSEALFKFGNHPDLIFQITNISLWMPKIKASLEVMKNLEANLSSNKIVDVNFTDLTLWRNSSPLNAVTNQVVNISTTSKKPIRVWVVFQTTNRKNGGQSTNKRVFDNVQVTEIEVRLNGRMYPLLAYKFIDPANTYQGFTRTYMQFMNAAYKMKDHDEGSLIDLETYYNLYPIYYFDITSQEESLFTATKYSELEIRWSNINVSNYNMNVLIESEKKIKISGINGTMSIAL